MAKKTWEEMTREEREAYRQSEAGQRWAQAKSSPSPSLNGMSRETGGQIFSQPPGNTSGMFNTISQPVETNAAFSPDFKVEGTGAPSNSFLNLVRVMEENPNNLTGVDLKNQLNSLAKKTYTEEEWDLISPLIDVRIDNYNQSGGLSGNPVQDQIQEIANNLNSQMQNGAFANAKAGTYDAAVQKAADEIKQISEQYGMPLTTDTAMYSTGNQQLDTVLGNNLGQFYEPVSEGSRYFEDTSDTRDNQGIAGLIAAAGLTLATGGLGSGLLGTLAKTGITSAGSQLASTGSIDPGKLAASLATAGILPNVPGLDRVYGADNFLASFGEGTINDAVGQALTTGELDINDALRSGLIQMSVDTALDVGSDARRSNPDNLMVGGTAFNGDFLTQDQLDNYKNTTDLFGLVGEDGLFSSIDRFNIPGGNLLANTIDKLSFGAFGGAPINQEAAANFDTEASFDLHEQEGLAGGMSPSEARQYAHQKVFEDFTYATTPYDEEFFSFAKRSNDSPYFGINTVNPIKANTPSLIVPGMVSGTSSSGAAGTSSSFSGAEGSAGGGSLPISDNLGLSFGSNSDTPIVDETLLMGDPNLLGTDSLPSDLTDDELLSDVVEGLPSGSPNELIAYSPDERLEFSSESLPIGFSDELPSGSAEELPAQSTSIVDEKLPTGGSGGVGATPVPESEFGNSDITDELFRLARVMEIENLPTNQRRAIQQRIQQLIDRGALDNVRGDVTIEIDPKSGRYITRKRDPDKEKEDFDPIAEALETVA